MWRADRLANRRTSEQADHRNGVKSWLICRCIDRGLRQSQASVYQEVRRDRACRILRFNSVNIILPIVLLWTLVYVVFIAELDSLWYRCGRVSYRFEFEGRGSLRISDSAGCGIQDTMV